MNKFELYDKYGEYNFDKFYIQDHEKWHIYAQNNKLYKKKKRIALLCLLFPIIGIIMVDSVFSEMGLSVF